MKWLALNRKDGQRDLYAIGFVTHTVCKVYVLDQLTYEAWRLPGTRLGGGYLTAQAAEAVCEADFRAHPPMLPTASTEADTARTRPDASAVVGAGRS